MSIDAKFNADAIVHSIQTILESHEAAWNAGDIQSLLSGYKNDENLRYASGAEVLRGYNAVRARFLREYPDVDAMGSLSFDEIEVTPLSTSKVMTFGRWRIQKKSGTVEGLFTLLFDSSDGQWLIVNDHTSVGERTEK